MNRRHPTTAALLGGAALATALSACAQQAAPDPPPGIRVRVTPAAPWTDLDAFSRRAAQAAGTRVRDAAASSTTAFSLTLICADAAACDRALAQLARATDFVSEAVREGRMGIPRPILPNDPKAR